ncbi:MAG: hypothetical protein DCC49_02070 [Acidobacteria bacterium]|nr:MAG: hypothetical protein DCC49_02070 [Acidobacteriota bacterium]
MESFPFAPKTWLALGGNQDPAGTATPRISTGQHRSKPAIAFGRFLLISERGAGFGEKSAPDLRPAIRCRSRPGNCHTPSLALNSINLGVLAMTQSESDRPPCPKCGSANVLELIYGLVGSPDDLAEGTVPRGCIVEADSPRWLCSSCRHEWGTPEEIQRVLDNLDLKDE